MRQSPCIRFFRGSLRPAGFWFGPDGSGVFGVGGLIGRVVVGRGFAGHASGYGAEQVLDQVFEPVVLVAAFSFRGPCCGGRAFADGAVLGQRGAKLFARIEDFGDVLARRYAGG